MTRRTLLLIAGTLVLAATCLLRSDCLTLGLLIAAPVGAK